MELKLIASTPDVERLIATAVLTTCSRKTPQEIYEALGERREKVEKMMNEIILKHGSVLEHNRLVFLAEAEDGEVLELLLANRFVEATRLEPGRWLLSFNLRVALSLLKHDGDLPEGVREGLAEALRAVASTLYWRVMGREG